MSYEIDAKTIALYEDGILKGGSGGGAWGVSPAAGGGYTAPATEDMIALFQAADWTVEASVSIADGPGTLLELAGWGETEATNIQVAIGWDDQRRPWVGWETGDGQDWRVRADAQLPADAPLFLAVTHSQGRIWIACNGKLLVEAAGIPPPTGGLYPGGVVPGMTLSLGRRVSTPDPEIFDGYAWVRVSTGRTLAEIRDDYDSRYPPTPPTAPTWEDLARTDGTLTYYVFRGRFGDAGTVVTWATAYVQTDDGLLEGRLLEAPSSIVSGIPETIGAMPERVSTELVLDNTDRALDGWLIGGTDATDEYSKESFLDLRGRIWMGLVAPDGSTQERPLTPTMVVAGRVTAEGGHVTVPLASRDTGVLGPTRKLVTVRELRDAILVETGDAARLNGDFFANGWGEFDWNSWRAQLTQGLDSTVPYAFGRNPFPLVQVSDPGDGALRRFVAWASMQKPDLSKGQLWRLRGSPYVGPLVTVWSCRVRVERTDGSVVEPWIVGVDVVDPYGALEDNARLYLEPPPEARVGLPAGTLPTPANIIRYMVRDLSDRGATAVDAPSFDRASAGLPLYGAIGGVVGSDAALAEIIAHITPLGLAVVMGQNDRLHCLVVGGWTAEEAEMARGRLPHITEGDIYDGSWSEWVPYGGSERGSAASRVSIEWSSEQVALWPPRERNPRAPGMPGVDLAEEIEVRISGAWLYPPESDTALGSMAARRIFTSRRFAWTMKPWIAAMPIGSLLRVSHPWGAEPTKGRYDRRLVRLERIELSPREDACRVVVEDLGQLEHTRVGKLDTIEHWIRYRPNGNGVTATLKAGTGMVTFSAPVADPSWEGCSFGAWTHSANRASTKILKFYSPTEVEVARTWAEDEVLPGHQPCDAIDEWWIVLDNRITKGWDYRPDYITLAGDNGLHSDGTPGFRMIG